MGIILHHSSGPSDPVVIDLDAMMDVVMGSEWLAFEPELEGILFDPLETVIRFLALAEERDLDPERLDEIPDEERGDPYLDILIDLAEELLTEELRQEVRDGLEAAEKRLAQAGQLGKAAEAGLLRSFLGMPKSEPAWRMTGLLIAIMQRSVQLGIQLAEASAEAVLGVQADRVSGSLWHRLSRSPVVARIARVAGKLPGVRRVLARRVDSMWTRGIKALQGRNLVLGLYSREELEEGLSMVANALNCADPLEMIGSRRDVSLTQAEAKALSEGLQSFIAARLTPAWLGRARNKVMSLLAESSVASEWMPFVAMVANALQSVDTAQGSTSLLASALFGEMANYGAELVAGRGGDVDRER